MSSKTTVSRRIVVGCLLCSTLDDIFLCLELWGVIADWDFIEMIGCVGCCVEVTSCMRELAGQVQWYVVRYEKKQKPLWPSKSKRICDLQQLQTLTLVPMPLYIYSSVCKNYTIHHYPDCLRGPVRLSERHSWTFPYLLFWVISQLNISYRDIVIFFFIKRQSII